MSISLYKICTLFECQGILHESTNWGYYFYISKWRRARHFTWSSKPREGLAACSAKGVPSIISYLKALSVGPALGIEPATPCSADKYSTNWAIPAVVPENRIYILFIVCHCPFANLHGDWIHLSMYLNYPLMTLNWPEWKHAVLFSV